MKRAVVLLSGGLDSATTLAIAKEEGYEIFALSFRYGQRHEIDAPLIEMTKEQIIREGVKLGVQFSLTTSCYDPTPDGRACGECDSCLLRRKGFREAGIPDPTRYARHPERSRGIPVSKL